MAPSRSTRRQRRSSTAWSATLRARAGLPKPKIYLIDNPQPNAFATGRNPENAAVAATTGLLKMLNRDEIAGVMAHELAHVKNRDSLTMTITAVLAGAIGMLANFAFFFGGSRDRESPLGGIGALLVMLLAPLAAMLVQFAISRSREYEADRIGAAISGQPALARFARSPRSPTARRRSRTTTAEANPATAHLFIINPLPAAARTACSPPTRRRRTASTACWRWRATCAPEPSVDANATDAPLHHPELHAARSVELGLPLPAAALRTGSAPPVDMTFVSIHLTRRVTNLVPPVRCFLAD